MTFGTFNDIVQLCNNKSGMLLPLPLISVLSCMEELQSPSTLGHRRSIDFDCFRSGPLDKNQLRAEFAFVNPSSRIRARKRRFRDFLDG